MYKKAEASFWTAEEMDLSKDMHDWNNRLNVMSVTSSLTSSLSSPLLMVLLTKIWSSDSRARFKLQKRGASTVSKS
jgi:hypothetical protein